LGDRGFGQDEQDEQDVRREGFQISNLRFQIFPPGLRVSAVNSSSNIYITQKRGNTRYIVVNQILNPLQTRYKGVTNPPHPLHCWKSGTYRIPHSAFRTPNSNRTRYIVVNQALKWQHNWQQTGNTRYIVDYQVVAWMLAAIPSSIFRFPSSAVLLAAAQGAATPNA
jgi:hypothetical protein